MDDNKKLICAAAGALGALVAVSATVFAIKQHKKKQNAMLLEELDLCLDGDDIAELANEAEETKAPETAEETKAPETAEEPKAEEPTESAPVAEEKVEEEAEEKTDNYILPDSSKRILADSEVSGLSKSELRLARNEIFARHGRMFDDQELQDYFNSKSWYRGTIRPEDFSESMLSETEKANIETIKKYE